MHKVRKAMKNSTTTKQESTGLFDETAYSETDQLNASVQDYEFNDSNFNKVQNCENHPRSKQSVQLLTIPSIKSFLSIPPLRIIVLSEGLDSENQPRLLCYDLGAVIEMINKVNTDEFISISSAEGDRIYLNIEEFVSIAKSYYRYNEVCQNRK